MKKLLIFFVICAGIVTFSCSKNNKAENPPDTVENESPGKTVYVKSCRLCHGNNGDLGLSGAANLKISALTVDEIKVVVSEGRKGMPGWKTQLSPEQIQLVAEYVLTLRK